MEFDTKSIILGILAILSMIITFLLSVLELKEKKKKILGFKISDIKRYAAFLTLILTLVTFMVETYSEMETQRKANQEQNTRDSLARQRFQETIDSLNKDIILAQQTLQSQNEVLEKQRVLNRQSARILLPLRDLYFSFNLTYDSADIKFPDYYKRMYDIYKSQREYGSNRYLRWNSNGISICVTNRDIVDQFLPKEEPLQKVNAVVTFVNYDPNTKMMQKPELGYKLLAWMYGFDIQKFDGLRPKIEQPYEITFYEIIIDFENRKLTQAVERASYQKFDEFYTISSLTDIFYPENPENRFIVFTPPYNRRTNGYPELNNLKIHFGEHSFGITIPDIKWVEQTNSPRPTQYKVNVKTLQKYFLLNGDYKKIPGHDLK